MAAVTRHRSHPRPIAHPDHLGGTVARAKRTQRADARRRYRASLAETETGESDVHEDGSAAASTTAASAARKPARTTPAPAQRPGIATAFRESFRPLDLRGDLRALPRLLTHWSFLVPVALSGAAVAAIPIFGLTAITTTFYQYFSYTAPIGSSFIAGFFAPRASYLIGGLAAFASFLFQAIAFNIGAFSAAFVGAKDANGAPIDPNVIAAQVLNQALTIGVLSGAFFAAAAAWYRRFLRTANPNRSQPSQSSGKRPDGKVPKPKQGRPLLARRR
jgi:hypothetical protein